jgi:hypothetical protein
MTSNILFRGKEIKHQYDNCESAEFVYGYYVKYKLAGRIIDHRIFTGKQSLEIMGDEYYSVVLETVGQLRYENQHGQYFDGDVYYHAGCGLCVVVEYSPVTGEVNKK